MTAELPEVGDCIAGKYDVERVLGEGGMGRVYAAMHRELRQRVAVKLLHPQISGRDSSTERFRREARAAAAMRGEHVCRVLDVGTHEDMPYIVMEYLEGRDLADELEARGPLPPEEAIDYVLQTCEALAEAHAAGIVHRDLKPANLFLSTRKDGTRHVKVLDFGVSKTLAGTSGEFALTDTSMMIGSPLYMSPEQLDSARDVDGRSDIWALGTVLYELLTNATPFDGNTIAGLVASVLQGTPKSLRDHDVEAPEALQAVINRALAKDRDARYTTVAELANALAPFGSPVGRQCADRAVRVLEASGIDSGVKPAPADTTDAPKASSAKTRGDAATPGSRSDAAGSVAASAVDPLDKTAGTPMGWDRSSIESAPRRRPIVIGVGALVVVGALVAWMLQRDATGAEPKSATPGVAPAEPLPQTAPDELAPQEQPAPVVEALPQGVAPPPATEELEASPEEPAAADATDQAAGATAKTSGEDATDDAAKQTDAAREAAAARRRQAARERRQRAAASTPQAPAPKPKPPQPSSGISDFGGRR